MDRWQLKTPVAFIIFNRPDTTERVFAEIARARPPRLLVIADGPRVDRQGENILCEKSREIINRVDWECDVQANYSAHNMGCKSRVSSGLDWVFETVEQAIILEDDCLPVPGFFRFCDELLEKYKHKPEVGHISGNNFLFGNSPFDGSYYFSRYTHVWGWATWRRAWQRYDVDLSIWPDLKDNNIIFELLQDDMQARYWSNIFERVYKGKINTWDYQWVLSNWISHSLAINPRTNLVSNIGFGDEATHTTKPGKYSNMEATEPAFPLQHPKSVNRCQAADKLIAQTMFSAPLLERLINFISIRK